MSLISWYVLTIPKWLGCFCLTQILFCETACTIWSFKIAMENHQFWRENSLFLWQFSTVMLNYQRVYVKFTVNFPFDSIVIFHSNVTSAEGIWVTFQSLQQGAIGVLSIDISTFLNELLHLSRPGTTTIVGAWISTYFNGYNQVACWILLECIIYIICYCIHLPLSG